MRLEARLYEANLLQRQRSIDVFAMQAKWRAVPAGDDDEHLYGRPVAFYQQLQQLNLEREWSQVRVPVLAMHSEYDWIMSRDDHERIVALVNGNIPWRRQVCRTARDRAHVRALREYVARLSSMTPG